MEAVDEIDGGFEALGGGEDEHRVRFVVRDDINVVRQVALLAQVVARAYDKLTLRVVEFVSTLCVIVHTVSVVKQRGPHINRG